jgi:hypothetical protein
MIMKNAKLELTNELIGKYINRVLYSDVDPVGKIVGIKGKTKVLIQPISASENKTKMDFIPGGFSAHCTNMYDQSYEFYEDGEVFEATLSKTAMKKRFWSISQNPRKFYDYNF